mgnify:CR=1 FL=1
MPRLATLRSLSIALILAACANPGPVGPDEQPLLQLQPPTQLPCSTCSPAEPFFFKPFDGEFPAVNLFDHDPTFTNSRSTFGWGEVVQNRNIGTVPLLIEGHQAYDWAMPGGTSVYAVAAGRVTGIINGNPNATCPFTAPQLTQQRRVTLRHTLPDGTVIQTQYDHLSAIQVSLNDTVQAGWLIGRSGQTGCARGPHLHFATHRIAPNGSAIPIDPYGWSSRTASDPWTAAANGAESITLWRTGRFPERRLTRSQTIAPGFNAGITSVAWMGDNDPQKPNNEELILTFNGTATDVFRIAAVRGDRSGLNHVFAPQPTISAARPRLHIRTGAGTSNDTLIYLNRTPVWDNNLTDCARIVFAINTQVRLDLGNGC